MTYCYVESTSLLVWMPTHSITSFSIKQLYESSSYAYARGYAKYCSNSALSYSKIV